ncbi:MAG: hypothetical protein DDT18_01122 [Actinobacteria bacterium]|uniref:Uncharacterized protein n=1 Tax=Candidatus Hakubella thermalkaliphila TaxID=2754717 RepID=A0A6V8PB37_9ACTN|nr:hypothetical protein [Actinomycetota bacterium]GFP28066.1 hypothetical protein HKBW3S33_01483 [Candidatus Hakubella thermalkaliphila]
MLKCLQVISKNHLAYLRDRNFQFVKNLQERGIDFSEPEGDVVHK